MREVVRFQDAYHSFQKVLSGLLMRLICSFLKLAFSLAIITFLLIFSEKLDILSKILFFSEKEVSEYHFPSSPGIFLVRLS